MVFGDDGAEPTSLLRGWQDEDADDDLHAGIQDLLTRRPRNISLMSPLAWLGS